VSVRPEQYPSSPSLSTPEGELVNVSIAIEPRLLEQVLEALARLPFPVNPQIYHHAGIGYVYADGREEVRPATLVDFPAFSRHLEQVRRSLAEAGVPPGAVHVRSILEDIHSELMVEKAPDKAPYTEVKYYKRFPLAS